MPVRENICYFPLMSCISPSHFLGVILCYSDVVVSDTLCSAFPEVLSHPLHLSLTSPDWCGMVIDPLLSVRNSFTCNSAGWEKAEVCRELLQQPASAGNKCGMEG